MAVGRAIIRLLAERLRGRPQLGFGDPCGRPQSYYNKDQSPGHINFYDYVWHKVVDLPAIDGDAVDQEEYAIRGRCTLCPAKQDASLQSDATNLFGRDRFEGPCTDLGALNEHERVELIAWYLIHKHLSQDECRGIERVANYADLYGHWVEALRNGDAPMPTELQNAVEAWARSHMPPDCLQQAGGLQAAAGLLSASLRRDINSYRFDEDFLLAWMIPRLVRTAAAICAPVRPVVNDAVRQNLTTDTQRAAQELKDRFGIAVDVQEMVDRTLQLVIKAPQPVYDTHRAAGPTGVRDWARAVLREQTLAVAGSRWQPRMDWRDRWGFDAAEDGLELQKRKALLEAFLCCAGTLPPAPPRPHAGGAGLLPPPVLPTPPLVGVDTTTLQRILTQERDACLRSLAARGWRVVDTEPRLTATQGRLLASMAGSTLPEAELRRRVKDEFITSLVGAGFALPAADIGNVMPVRGRLNDKQAVCLWLGLFYDQSTWCEGLWQMYVDCIQEEYMARCRLPDAVNRVFNDPAGGEDEILDYCEREQGLAEAALTAARLDPIGAGEICKLLAWIILTRLGGQDPATAARKLACTMPDVFNSLRRGYNVLHSELLKDIHAAI